MRVPTGTQPNQWEQIPAVARLSVDSAGRVLSAAFAFPETPFASFWQAPAAVTPNIHEPPYHGPTRPNPSRIRQLSSGGLPGLKAVWGHAFKRLVPGRPQEVDLAAASLSARRVGNAWLVVRGGSGPAQRLRVLDALRISKLHVRR